MIGIKFITVIVQPTVTHSSDDAGMAKKKASVSYHHFPSRETAFDRPRDFLGNRYVYAVISSRAGGLSLGVNMNPDKKCNFDCSYCEVDRRVASKETRLDAAVMAAELR